MEEGYEHFNAWKWIRDLIGLSSKVTVLYHNNRRKAELIKNLINIW